MSYIIDDTKLKNIADAVRYKCGGWLMNITTMINKLSQLQQTDGAIDVSQYSGDMALWYAVRIATFDPDIIDTSNMESMDGMFAEWPFTDTLDFQNIDTSSATNMFEMFKRNQATYLTNLTGFDTSNVTTIREMFQSCKATSLDLSGWDVSSVTLMDHVFNGCENLESIDLSGWDTHNVTDMTYMFAYMRNRGGKIWVPSTFVATNVTGNLSKPFYYAPNDPQQLPFGYWKLYTDATDAQTQGWGTVNSNFIVYYNSTHQDFLNA